MTPRKLLLVNAEGATTSAGGAETIVSMLARGLAERGWEVEILAAFPTERPREPFPVATLHRTHWRSSTQRRVLNRVTDVASWPVARLVDAVRASGAEVVHTHNLPGISTAAWEAARRAGARVVHTLHDYYLLCPRVSLIGPSGAPCAQGRFCTFRTRRLERWSGSVGDVVGVSNAVLARHAGFFPRVRRHLIRHPWSAPERAAEPPASPPRTIGYLGALDVTKGVHLLLAAAPRLAELGFDVEIAGDGRLRPAVEESAERLTNVAYRGHVAGEERARLLARCDVGIVPSIWDEPGGPPLTLLDWLGAGRPTLSSGRGGLGEIEGARGVLEFEPTVEALIDAVARLRDPTLWDELRAGVRPPKLPSYEEWLDAHERVLSG